MISNALAGVAVGYALGMKDEEIIRGIEKLVPIAGRNNLIEAEHYTIIDDCYNANPASMKSSLDVLAFADNHLMGMRLICQYFYKSWKTLTFPFC